MGFKVTLDREKCTGCEECLELCSSGVFGMQNGKAVPVNANECIGCESCIEVCEPNAICIEETRVQMSDQCQALLRDIL
jgi:NAD-dependent dihydropyrimidine dehydrogenase PreA subunit